MLADGRSQADPKARFRAGYGKGLIGRLSGFLWVNGAL
jgi:hypothetical protein